ncbi:hypothetical protein BXZ70DRAFT_1067032 [Cristinia sonorae]|uniref:F-box domain-containing protein n=1 Tax=Cristinia sonorae TaxID=1940300 RepID=A0A8K0UHG5_9AGAR|nr:hypothetical protein BXZ70DRAFT_1067032 [Cristinia sonorae]
MYGPPSRLPQELMEEIVDHALSVGVDSRILALVCHSWLTKARRALFWQVLLVGSLEKARSFMSLLATSSSISQSIRRLHIGQFGSAVEETQVPMTTEIFLPLLSTILQELTRLRTLRIYNVRFVNTPSGNHDSDPQPLIHIEALEFYGPTNTNWTQIASCCNSVQTLFLFNFSHAAETRQNEMDPPRHTKLIVKRLRLHSTFATMKLRRLLEDTLGTVDMTSVQHLDIGRGTSIPGLYSAIIESVAPTIKTILVHLDESLLLAEVDSPTAFVPLDLFQCTQLESIILKADIDRDIHEDDLDLEPSLWRSLDILATLPPSIRNVTIRLSHSSPDLVELVEHQWRRIASFFQRLPALKTVTVDIVWMVSGERLSAERQEEMQKSLKRSLDMPPSCEMVFQAHDHEIP